MQIHETAQPITEIEADAIVVSVAQRPEDHWELSPSAQAIDETANGLLSNLLKQGEIATGENCVTKILSPEGLRTSVLVVVGMGNKTSECAGVAFHAAGAAAKSLAAKKRSKVVMALDMFPVSDVIAGAMMGCVGQDIFRKNRKLFEFDELLVATEAEGELESGVALGEAINLTRRLVNLPANEVFPESFAEACHEQGKKAGFEVEVWDETRLHDERCGALLAVAQGSERPPRLVIMRYLGADKSQLPVGLVGKGVTFDSGGLSLKPSDGMIDMKCDMAGAATVLGAMTAIAKQQLPVNVFGLVGLAENMVSGRSFKLGDVLVARNGKTIEVLNTDAEGRLVLADVLNVATEQGVDRNC
ncbi:MAG: M17 family peptidase N-terminal domain-containing protein [Pirellulaceae bacterium]